MSCHTLAQGYAGLSTKKETTETTVENLYCLFLYIIDFFQLQTYYLFAKLLNKP